MREKLNPDLYSFLRGALGYLGGAVAGFLFIYLADKLGLTGWLFDSIDETQTFLQILALPLIAGFVLALGGGILGGIGGWVLASNISTSRRLRLAMGSGVAFAASMSLLLMVFLILTSFIALYNNFTTDRIEQYGILFGLFGLVFGLFTGLIQAFTTVRLRHTWRVILGASLGFALGGVVMGLLIRWVNPTAGLQTYPILTTLVLLLALASPYIFGGGALGLVYSRLARRVTQAGEPVESIQSPTWQIVIVAVLAVLIIAPILNLLDDVTRFLTINSANTQTQIAPVTVGVGWSDAQTYTPQAGEYRPELDAGARVTVTGQDQAEHQAWCSSQGVIHYQGGGGPEEQIPYPGCSSAPAITLGADGRAHLVWYTQEIRDTNGVTRAASSLVESIRGAEGWSEAAIAAQTQGEAYPSLSSDPQGNLYLVWAEPAESEDLFMAIQENYQCSEEELSAVELAGLESTLMGDFRPAGTEVPYCRNQFERILYTPNPDAAYSDQPVLPNGAFDLVADIVGGAEYEALFTVMQYMDSSTPPSPGTILAEAVADLYRQVKANPEQYPRGMTVRIMLGNYPVFSDFNWGSQVMSVIADLKAAGVEKMVDEEIGWRIEVANFPGTYPHSHTKFLIVDGKTSGSLGFNYSYLHFSKDHPSGKGDDLFDLGMVVVGPVSQDMISHYDDMWEGADIIHCEDLSLADGEWERTCQEEQGIADHVPEVLRAYLPPEGDSNAFSLYRNSVFNEADEFIEGSLAAASESIDIMQANFSLDLHCLINLFLPGVCTLEDALPFMNALLESVEENNTRVRVIMENANSYGLENRVTAMVIYPELERRGLADLVELRFFNGRIHAKATLIDEALLIIGSQNMHYSAWGEGGGLGEHNVTTSDPQAIAEFKRLFDFKWQAAIPFEEAEYATKE